MDATLTEMGCLWTDSQEVMRPGQVRFFGSADLQCIGYFPIHYIEQKPFVCALLKMKKMGPLLIHSEWNIELASLLGNQLAISTGVCPDSHNVRPH